MRATETQQLTQVGDAKDLLVIVLRKSEGEKSGKATY